MAYERETPSTSLREGSEPQPPAREAQCRVQVSAPMEGSAQGGVTSKRGRPPQKPPRKHPGAQSQAATGLSTPASDPEPRGPLPLRQHEDLGPSTAEHRGEEAGAGNLSVRGGALSFTGRSPPELGLGLEHRLASHHLADCSQRRHPVLAILREALGSCRAQLGP